MGRYQVLGERNFRVFLTGYFISYTAYWVTLLAIGWWIWEVTHSAAWTGFIFFCDLFPALLVTPYASAMADKGDRFAILKAVLWIQVVLGFSLAGIAAVGLLTPMILAIFVFVDGMLVGVSQPAFFGMINRIVSKENLSAAVGLNSSAVQTTYILGPLLAGLLFTFGIGIIPIALGINAAGVLIYLYALGQLNLHPAPERGEGPEEGVWQGTIEGISIFWKNPMVFSATVLLLSTAVIQRPLLSMLPGVNDNYDLLPQAFFTWLAACLMAGNVAAGLYHATRNEDAGVTMRLALGAVAVIALLVVTFLGLGWFNFGVAFAMIMLFLLGFGCSYVTTGNVIVLQNRTPEAQRSRVLGNNFMMSRAMGAIALIVAGFAIERFGFTYGMLVPAVFSAGLLLLALARWQARTS